jgi:hypothetical protein
MDKINLLWVPIVEVLAFAKDQVRMLSDVFGSVRDIGTLSTELAKGWNPLRSFLTVRKITDKDDVKSEIQAHLDYAKSLTETVSVYVDGIEVKVPASMAHEDFQKAAKPKYRIVKGGQRRGFCLPIVALARRMRGLSEDFKVPVMIVDENESDESCFVAAIDENIGKNAGAKDMTWLDYVNAATVLVDRFGYGQSDLCRAFGKIPQKDRYFGDKLHNQARVNLQSKGEFLKLDPAILKKLNHVQSGQLADSGEVTPTNVAEKVKAIFTAPPKVKPMKTSDVEEIGNSHRDKSSKKDKNVVYRLCQAFKLGDRATFAAVCNEITD